MIENNKTSCVLTLETKITDLELKNKEKNEHIELLSSKIMAIGDENLLKMENTIVSLQQ